jgi:hypothetical protein
MLKLDAERFSALTQTQTNSHEPIMINVLLKHSGIQKMFYGVSSQSYV